MKIILSIAGFISVLLVGCVVYEFFLPAQISNGPVSVSSNDVIIAISLLSLFYVWISTGVFTLFHFGYKVTAYSLTVIVVFLTIFLLIKFNVF